MRFPATDAINKCMSYYTVEPYRMIIVLGSGGSGKSYDALSYLLYDAIVNDKPFGIMYESRTIISYLCANNGNEFFSGLLFGWSKHKTKKQAKLFKLINSLTLEEEIMEDKPKKKRGRPKKIKEEGKKKRGRPKKIEVTDPEEDLSLRSGVLKYNGKVICVMVSYNDFSLLKGGNTVIKRVMVDEFIPEKVTFRNADVDEKITSLLETQGRDRLELLIMLANPVRLKSPVMTKLGFSNIKRGETLVKPLQKLDGSYRMVPVEKGSTKMRPAVGIVCTYINFEANQEFLEMKEDTLASAFAIATGNTYRLTGRQKNISEDKDIVDIKTAGTRAMYVLKLYGIHVGLFNMNGTLYVKEIPLQSLGSIKCKILTPYRELVDNKVFFERTALQDCFKGIQGGWIRFNCESAKLAIRDALKLR